jgi:hypothetical protein
LRPDFRKCRADFCNSDCVPGKDVCLGCGGHL